MHPTLRTQGPTLRQSFFSGARKPRRILPRDSFGESSEFAVEMSFPRRDLNGKQGREPREESFSQARSDPYTGFSRINRRVAEWGKFEKYYPVTFT